MTKEHLGLALALSVPVFVVVTKIDMCPPNVLQETLKLLIRILKSPGCRKFPVLVKSKDDVILSATKFVSERLCPIFQVSNVNGENLDLLKMFLNLLGSRTPNTDEDPSEFQIDDTYLVPGVGKPSVLTILLVCSITYQEDLMRSQFLRPANYSPWKELETGNHMCGSCHFDRASNDEFNVECLF